MYISSRSVGICVLLVAIPCIIMAGPVEIKLHSVGMSHNCSLTTSVKDHEMASECVMIYALQFGYAVFCIVLLFVCIMMCRGDLICDVLTIERQHRNRSDSDERGYARMSTKRSANLDTRPFTIKN